MNMKWKKQSKLLSKSFISYNILTLSLIFLQVSTSRLFKDDFFLCFQLNALYYLPNMSNFSKLNPLKVSNSFDTNCTIDQQNNKGIKINIIHPIKKSSSFKDTSDNYLTYSKDSEEILTESVKKYTQPLVTSENKSQILGNMTLKSQKASVQPSIISQQNLIHNNISNTQNQQNMTNKIKTITTSAQNSVRKQPIDNNFRPIEQKKQSLQQRDHLIEIAERLPQKQDKLQSILIDISQDESFRDVNDLEVVDLDEKSILQTPFQEQRIVKPIVPPIELQNRNIRSSAVQSQRSTHQSRSNSKIKLRDYLYMVEATTKNKQMLKQPITKKGQSLRSSQIQNPPKLETITTKDTIIKPIERATIATPRRQHALLKYSISNAKMFDILKKQIHEDIKMVQKNLQKVDDQLVDLQIPGQTEPTNEQLLILYNIRRQIKQDMNKRLQITLQMIKDHKKGIASDLPNQTLKRKTPTNQHTYGP